MMFQLEIGLEPDTERPQIAYAKVKIDGKATIAVTKPVGGEQDRNEVATAIMSVTKQVARAMADDGNLAGGIIEEMAWVVISKRRQQERKDRKALGLDSGLPLG